MLMELLKSNPMVASILQMLNGKTDEQKCQAILDLCRQRGIDPNAKIFSEQQLREFGLTLPPRNGPQG